MKKIILLIVICTYALAQGQFRRQEVSVDVFDALVFRSLEITYEYNLNQQNTAGVSGLFNFNEDNADLRYNEDIVITPFFRHYFTTQFRWNYFGEIFLGINSGEKENDDRFIDAAFGIAGGVKYVANGGLVVSPLIGIGRNLFTDKSYEFLPRVGLHVGYRF